MTQYTSEHMGTLCFYFAFYLVISNIILTFATVNNKCIIMARQLRKESATGIHHVMLRGINRQDRNSGF